MQNIIKTIIEKENEVYNLREELYFQLVQDPVWFKFLEKNKLDPEQCDFTIDQITESPDGDVIEIHDNYEGRYYYLILPIL